MREKSILEQLAHEGIIFQNTCLQLVIKLLRIDYINKLTGKALGQLSSDLSVIPRGMTNWHSGN
jgi:hypothetical protein